MKGSKGELRGAAHSRSQLVEVILSTTEKLFGDVRHALSQPIKCAQIQGVILDSQPG